MYWLSFPEITFEDVCAKVATESESKEALESISPECVSSFSYLKPSKVETLQTSGYQVLSKYVIYSPKEFLGTHKENHLKFMKGKGKLFLSEITNENNKKDSQE